MPTYNPYVSQYVQAPIDEFLKAGTQLQQEYDENMLAGEKFRTLMANVKVLDAHKPILAQQLKQYQDGLGGIAKDGNWEDAGLAVRNLATRFAEDASAGDIATMRSTYENYQMRNAEKAKLGGDYAEWNDDWLAYERSGGIDPKTGKPLAYQFTGLAKAQDHQKRAGEMMDKIAEDGKITDELMFGEEGVTGVKTGREHITAEKVRNIARGKVDSFLTTIEGKDFSRMLAHNNPKLTEKEIRAASEEYLYQAGANQIHLKTNEEKNWAWNPKWKMDQEAQLATTIQDEADQGAVGNVAQTGEIDALGDVEADDLDADGLLKSGSTDDGTIAGAIGNFFFPEGGTAATAGFGGTSPGAKTIVKTESSATQKKILGEKQKQLTSLIANGDKMAELRNDKEWLGMTRKQKALAVAKSVKNNRTVTPTILPFGTGIMKDQAERTVKGKNLATLHGSQIVVVDNEDKSVIAKGNIDRVMDDYDLMPDDIVNIKPVGISYRDPHGMTGGTVYEVQTKKKTYTLYASPTSHAAKSMYEPIRKVNIAAMSHAPKTTVSITPDTDVRVKNYPTSSGTVSRVQIIRYDLDAHGKRKNIHTDDKGTAAVSAPMNLDDYYLMMDNRINGQRQRTANAALSTQKDVQSDDDARLEDALE